MIRIQNIYHMLAYAFRVLQEQGYRDVAAEDFDNAAELCAAILSRGVSLQLKQGLCCEYIGMEKPLSSLRGKIDITESIKTRSVMRRQLMCDFDEFSVDTHMNRIIKATCVLLLRADIGKGIKKGLRHNLAYFSDVGDIDLSYADWCFRFDRNNQTYRMLMGICWLVANGLLQTQSEGPARLMDFLDDQCMSRIYERFILEYYRQEHGELAVGAGYIHWVLDDDLSDMLPAMKSDIMLSQGSRMLIIDAKYYACTTQQHYDKNTIHSGNLYQIFSYVKNKDAEFAGVPREVSGLLLYAKTDEEVLPSGSYRMSGNLIEVRTLDLGLPFEDIRAQLDRIAERYFS